MTADRCGQRQAEFEVKDGTANPACWIFDGHAEDYEDYTEMTLFTGTVAESVRMRAMS